MKMGGIPSIGGLLDASFPRTRESRFDLRPISLDTRFRGYDGTQVTSSLWRPSPYMYFLRRPRAAQPQPNFGISRAKHAKGAKEERCHFERREKSFLDLAYSLRMTGLCLSLRDLGGLGARNIRIRGVSAPGQFAQAAQTITGSSTKDTKDS